MSLTDFMLSCVTLLKVNYICGAGGCTVYCIELLLLFVYLGLKVGMREEEVWNGESR